MPRADVLIVSLGGTAGLREADTELAGSLRRAGASVEVARVARPPELRTLAALELAWALNARRTAVAAVREYRPRAVIYSSTTAALLGPVAGAIRFDAPAAGNRPGRHGLWQRPVERRRFESAPLLVPWSEGGLAEAPIPRAGAVIVPVPVAPSGAFGERDIAALTYGANPEKKGLDRVLAAWTRDSRPGEELVVAGLDAAAGEAWLHRPGGCRDLPPHTGGNLRHPPEPPRDRLVSETPHGIGAETPGGGLVSETVGLVGACGAGRVRFAGMLSRSEYRALLRRARLFVAAPRREDYGIAQLEALADGCVLVTTPAPGPYAALPLARALDPRLVSDQLPIRAALDEPAVGYAERAAAAIAPWSPEAVDRVVAEELLPRLRALA